jgi:dihydrofolate reductase
MPRKPQEGPIKTTGQPTRRIRYQVAMSLDGFIAGPNGEADWIIMDPEIDFKTHYSQFDTLLMGRRTYEAMKAYGGGSMPGVQVFAFSHTLRQEDHPHVTIVGDPQQLVAELRSKPGKDIWLFGGGSLFRSLAELGLVDTVEVAVVPVLLGEGVPLLPAPARRITLKLIGHRLYANTGIMSLEYAVQYGQGPGAAGDPVQSQTAPWAPQKELPEPGEAITSLRPAKRAGHRRAPGPVPHRRRSERGNNPPGQGRSGRGSG